MGAAEHSSKHKQRADSETSEILPALTGDNLCKLASCSNQRILHTEATGEEEQQQGNVVKKKKRDSGSDVVYAD